MAVRAVIDDLKKRARKCAKREDIVHIGSHGLQRRHGHRRNAGGRLRAGWRGRRDLAGAGRTASTTRSNSSKARSGSRAIRPAISSPTRTAKSPSWTIRMCCSTTASSTASKSWSQFWIRSRRSNGSLLIVAENVEEAALPGILLNHIRRDLKAVVVKPPAYGDNRARTRWRSGRAAGRQGDPGVLRRRSVPV